MTKISDDLVCMCMTPLIFLLPTANANRTLPAVAGIVKGRKVPERGGRRRTERQREAVRRCAMRIYMHATGRGRGRSKEGGAQEIRAPH